MPKTVLITGCASGFGLSLTKILLSQHWQVIATVREYEDIGPALRSLAGPHLTICKLDVTQATDREKMKNFISEKLNNKLDCLINNAGYGLFGALEESDEVDIRYQLEVNLMGVIFLTQTLLPALRNTHGKIINISSMVAFLGAPLHSIYVASKCAIEGFSESLYYELAPHHVQVAIVEPGLYKTNFESNAICKVNENQQSVYTQQTLNLIKFRKLIARRKNKSPEILARAIAKLLEKKVMPLRTRVGWDITYRYLFWRLMPANLFNKVMKKFYHFIFSNA